MHNRLSDPVKETSICALNKTTCINSKDFAKIILKDRNGRNEEDNNEESVDIVEIKAKELNCSGDYNQKQLCIMEKLNKKKELIKYFKPITKSYSHSHWLNNTEIDTVQYQLMLNYKGYYYSNIHMIDFGMFNPKSKDIIEYDPLNIKNIDETILLKEMSKHYFAYSDEGENVEENKLKNFQYLLGMNIRNFTLQKMEDLQNDLKKYTDELKTVSNTTEIQMWDKDLNELETNMNM
jgi:hypothetical protein